MINMPVEVSAKMKIYIYGKGAIIDMDNPTWNGYTGLKLPYVELKAMITNGVTTWRENFKVSSLDVAQKQITQVIQFFNDTMHAGERPRSFVEFYYEDKEVASYEDNRGMSGWLDPEGIFHPCGFGEHVIYALDLAGDNRVSYNANTEIDELILNQHIPMSVMHQSSGAFISILSQLTDSQVEWFNRFFFKLSPEQKKILMTVTREQDIKLKYEW